MSGGGSRSGVIGALLVATLLAGCGGNGLSGILSRDDRDEQNLERFSYTRIYSVER